MYVVEDGQEVVCSTLSICVRQGQFPIREKMLGCLGHVRCTRNIKQSHLVPSISEDTIMDQSKALRSTLSLVADSWNGDGSAEWKTTRPHIVMTTRGSTCRLLYARSKGPGHEGKKGQKKKRKRWYLGTYQLA